MVKYEYLLSTIGFNTINEDRNAAAAVAADRDGADHKQLLKDCLEVITTGRAGDDPRGRRARPLNSWKAAEDKQK